MESETVYRGGNFPASLFAISRETRGPGDPFIVTEETTAWEIYNRKAAEIDRERVKDWNDSLNTLLIFVLFWSSSIP
jgi:hypothetical protein